MARIDPQLRNSLLNKGYNIQELYNRDPAKSAMGLTNRRSTLSYLPGEFARPMRAVRDFLTRRKGQKNVQERKRDVLQESVDRARARDVRKTKELQYNPYTGYSYE